MSPGNHEPELGLFVWRLLIPTKLFPWHFTVVASIFIPTLFAQKNIWATEQRRCVRRIMHADIRSNRLLLRAVLMLLY